MIMAADLDRPVAGIGDREGHGLAAGIELDVAVSEDEFTGDHGRVSLQTMSCEKSHGQLLPLPLAGEGGEGRLPRVRPLELNNPEHCLLAIVGATPEGPLPSPPPQAGEGTETERVAE